MINYSKRKDYLAFGKPNFSDLEINAVSDVMKTGWVGMGAQTIAFENELKGFLHAKNIVSVNSCTSALFLSLVALGIGAGDEVICPSLTWCSTVNAVLYAGAVPVFCDIDKNTLCADIESIKNSITTNTKAVIIVHYGGFSIDVDYLREELPKHVAIVEDSAHALGSKFKNNAPVGSSPNLSCFSFYANKNLAVGDGGAIAVNDEKLYKIIQPLSQQGLCSDAWKRFVNPAAALVPDIATLGYKMNFIDILAAIGRVQLQRQNEFHKIRLEIAQYYYEELNSFDLGIEFQNELTEDRHARHLFVIKLPVEKMKITRNDLVLKLREVNAGASIHYAPLHTMPYYKKICDKSLPVTEDLSKRIMTIPISASMNLEDAKYVIENLKNILLKELK